MTLLRPPMAPPDASISLSAFLPRPPSDTHNPRVLAVLLLKG
jgi:hypothetical protein